MGRALGVALTASLWLSAPRVLAAPSVIEVQPSAEASVDRAIVGRLVQLELSDVEVPAPPTARTASPAQVVFVRVYAKGAELTIEIWERGELRGTRHLSVKGSPSLLARRVALAAGEMAEHLREQRHLAWKNHKKQQARIARQNEALPFNFRAAPQLSVDLVSGWVPEGNAVVVGPRLSAGLRGANGADFLFGAAALSLKLGEPHLEPWVQWYEVTARPGYTLRVGSASGLRLGLHAGVATVHVGTGRLDNESGMISSETWSTRAGAEAQWRWRWKPHVELSVGLELNSVLRRIRLLDELGERQSFGGAWFGGTVGLNFL